MLIFTVFTNTFRFGDLPDVMSSIVDSVLRGWHPINELPNLKPKVVQVFISSTFTGKCHVDRVPTCQGKVGEGMVRIFSKNQGKGKILRQFRVWLLAYSV